MPDRIVLFDGVCDLCNSFVQFIIKHDPAGKFKFAPLRSVEAERVLEGMPIALRALDTVIYVRNGRVFTRSTAALLIITDLGGAWSSIRLLSFIPTFLRDLLYDAIAKHRYRLFGRREECMVPTPEISDRFLHSMNDREAE